MATNAVYILSGKSQENFPAISAETPSARLLPGQERCLLCKMPTRAAGTTLTICIQCVKTLESSNEFSEVLAQCCECGVLLNGISQGEVPLTVGGHPDLTVGSSHGICASCAVGKLSAHRAAGRQRRAAQG